MPDILSPLMGGVLPPSAVPDQLFAQGAIGTRAGLLKNDILEAL